MQTLRGRIFSPIVLAALLAVSPGLVRANSVVIFNQSKSTVWITTQVFQHASQTHSGYDSWVTQGWWSVPPGKAIQVYSGESSMFWLRATTNTYNGTALTWPNVTIGSAFINPNAFRLEAGSGSFFPAFDVQPGTAHWVYKASDLTAHGWSGAGGFNHLNSTGTHYIGGPKTISSKTLSFSYSANWNGSTLLNRKFQPPPGANVVYYTYSLSSSRGVQVSGWDPPFSSSTGPWLVGWIAGSGNFWDQWRGSYVGSVTLYYSYP